MTTHDWLDMAGAYALGSLDPSDQAEFEAHLRGCLECQRAVASYRDVTVTLADGGPRTAPPPHLRDEVLTRIQSEPHGGHAAAKPATATPQPFLRVVLVGATAASLVVAAVAAIMLQQSRHTVESLETALADNQAALAARDDAIAGQRELLDVLLAPELSTASLASAAPETPSLQLFLNRSSNALVVAAFNLSPAPAGRTYQLWGLSGDDPPVSLGLFDVPPNRGPVTMTADASDTFEIAAVTEEPESGSPQPTSAPFLVGPWNHGN